jgi:transcriptional regulator with XRE-family HTH domain
MTVTTAPSRPLNEVVGANCRRIRKEIGFSQDQLAAYARINGLKWNAAKVANFEAGRWKPTFETVLAVGLALNQALVYARIAAPATVRGAKVSRGRPPVTLAELFDGGSGFVALNDDVALPAADLTGIGRGEPFPDYGARLPERSLGLAEERVAKTFGISVARLADMSSQLWGATFSEERDRRAGANANRQKKGRVSRFLLAELENVL